MSEAGGSRKGRPAQRTKANRRLHNKIMSDSLTVITDPDELKRLEAECTPPSEIKTRHGMAEPYERGLFLNRNHRRGFGCGRGKTIY